MASSFSISRSRFSAFSDAALIDEIRSHTGSDDEASSILGCIERLGDDPDIRYYEVSPRKNNRTYRDAPVVAWSVRAVRP